MPWWTAIASCSTCSSNSEGRTTAAAPASSNSSNESIDPVSGDDDAITGDRSESPR